ncbi:MAG: phosphatidylserine/phosphatidylglycerophosphate/cardiolipin synthase family protein [Deltaproteobacteria bacterium]|nr:phosphatidylserine/phosphatidylglycerophosphate/cardiolipin synthase family protein [Deltaproteobacteria bacterium]MBW2359697.1 phosphatidylserine/phosphatidylglycerophosphate/cardiolipin synthase family protein [Deltaproteobacteria bacterium]
MRDLLAERVARVPAGGSIDWVTYYFRDRRLAGELVAARRRGVAVRVTLEGRPRSRGANAAVIALLEEALGDGLRVVAAATDGLPMGKALRPRLHEKLYCFSHPQPTAWVGSFNPSGDEPELAPEVIRQIGDHDHAFNLLVELCDEPLVAALAAHARQLHSARHGPFDRFGPAANRSLAVGDAGVHFWPRIAPDPVNRLLFGLPSGSRVRLAASHLSGPTARRVLTGIARSGVTLEILVDSTHRRVPAAMLRQLSEVGGVIRRIGQGESWIPMHDKFALVETPTRRSAVFGSFNWSRPSRSFNREIGVVSGDAPLFAALAERWEELGQHASPAAPGSD